MNNGLLDTVNVKLVKAIEFPALKNLSQNAAKTKFIMFHNYQKYTNEDDIPHLTIKA